MLYLLLQLLLPANTFTIVNEPIVLEAEVTMYNATISQTDDDPMITASNRRVNQFTAACPPKYMGKWIKVKGKDYRCDDLMARRYRESNEKMYFDLIADTKQEAINWGRQKIAIMVYN